MIQSVIENELDETKDLDSLSQLESLIGDVENNFDISLSKERDRVLGKMSDSEDNEASPAKTLLTRIYDKDTLNSDVLNLFKEDMFTR